MQVIFIKDLKGQGKKGEIKEVSDGYALNFLIKKGYAVKKTDGSINRLNFENENNRKLDLDNRNKALKEKEKLEKENITFYGNSGKDGRMFGTVSSKQIKDYLDKLGYKIDKKNIKCESINSFGIHNVNIVLYKDIEALIKVSVKVK